MQKNVGRKDKSIRIILGLIIAVLGLVYQTWWAIIVGIILIGTGLIGFCGLYSLVGVSTCPQSGAEDSKEQEE